MERLKILERGENGLRSSEGLVDGLSSATGGFVSTANCFCIATALGDIVDRIDRRNEDTSVEFSFPSILIDVVIGFGVLTASRFNSIFFRCRLYGVNGVLATFSF